LNGADGSWTRYFADHEGPFGRLFVAVSCFVGGQTSPLLALLDTASEWCMMPMETAIDLGYDLRAEGAVRIRTRFGIVTGRLEVAPVEFRSELEPTSGTAPRVLTIDATWFVSEEWPGPAVIGWKGCLERMRFGLDPGHDLFYFAEL
jgi:hypothetical protein